MNTNIESHQILNHVTEAIKQTIENEMMTLSMVDLIGLIMDYKAMQYKPSAQYTAICEAAEQELSFRESRIRRQYVKNCQTSAE